jgi:hypothetical protein
MNIEIKIVRERCAAVDFDDTDAYEWAVYAIRHEAWRVTCETGQARVAPRVGAAVAIAAPDGRVAVWYGAASLRVAPTGKIHSARTSVNLYEAALAATGNAAVAAYWDPRRTRGGDRDVRALALSACRVLHAAAFGDTPSLRDQLLAEFAAITTDRPPTPHLLRASEDELLAASALLSMQDCESACKLLARKGVCAS